MEQEVQDTRQKRRSKRSPRCQPSPAEPECEEKLKQRQESRAERARQLMVVEEEAASKPSGAAGSIDRRLEEGEDVAIHPTCLSISISEASTSHDLLEKSWKLSSSRPRPRMRQNVNDRPCGGGGNVEMVRFATLRHGSTRPRKMCPVQKVYLTDFGRRRPRQRAEPSRFPTSWTCTFGRLRRDG